MKPTLRSAAIAVRSTLGALLPLVALATPAPARQSPEAHAAESRVRVRFVTDEADAALALLQRVRQEGAGSAAVKPDLAALRETEGYRRLRQREVEQAGGFDEAAFERYLLNADLAARAPALERTLAQWIAVDLAGAAAKALAYLPPQARIHARIYPVIKPRPNSFVFQPATDAAIFLFLDPEMTAAQLENTIAHEMHHIGYASLEAPDRAEIARLPAGAQSVVHWIGAFGEGFAMLAAAGGPDVHPHAASKTEDRERWDRDLAHFDRDLAAVQKFFEDLLAGRLSVDAAQKTAASFYGVQGPWYTVGYQMAVVIETELDRAALLECIVAPRRLLAVYNEAAAQHNAVGDDPLALWSPELLAAIAGPAK